MGFAAFLIAIILGAGVAYVTGRKPVQGGLYCGIGFAAASILVFFATNDPGLALFVAGPVGVGAAFAAPKEDGAPEA